MAEMIQGTAEWFAARLGKVTASRIVDVTARTKAGKPTAERERYMGQLIAERLTGSPAPRFTSAEMMWGVEQEPVARAAYEFLRDVTVDQVGFIPHPRFSQSGASPDGLVGDKGCVEFKCPMTATHVRTILAQDMPEEYGPQVQWQMACTGRSWCDFGSYDPRVPDEMKLFLVRIARDDAEIAVMERQVGEFLAELDERLARLGALVGLAQAA